MKMSSKPVFLKQILKMDPPAELTFTGPFHQAVSSVMTFTNPSDRKVCFKIKTTAPDKYCVKPKNGVIEPKQTIEIEVYLLPIDFDSECGIVWNCFQTEATTRHKFMIQTMFAPPGEIDQESFWKEADSSQIMKSMLRCLLRHPENSVAINDSIPGNGDSSQSTSCFTSLNEDKTIKVDVLCKAPLQNTTQDSPSVRPNCSEIDTSNVSNADEDSLTYPYCYSTLLFIALPLLFAASFVIISGKFVEEDLENIANTIRSYLNTFADKYMANQAADLETE
jgi:hypothetical protein